MLNEAIAKMKLGTSCEVPSVVIPPAFGGYALL